MLSLYSTPSPHPDAIRIEYFQIFWDNSKSLHIRLYTDMKSIFKVAFATKTIYPLKAPYKCVVFNKLSSVIYTIFLIIDLIEMLPADTKISVFEVKELGLSFTIVRWHYFSLFELLQYFGNAFCKRFTFRGV